MVQNTHLVKIYNFYSKYVFISINFEEIDSHCMQQLHVECDWLYTNASAINKLQGCVHTGRSTRNENVSCRTNVYTQNQKYTPVIPSLLYLTAQQSEKCFHVTGEQQYHTEVPVNASVILGCYKCKCTQVQYLSTLACHLLTVSTNYDLLNKSETFQS